MSNGWDTHFESGKQEGRLEGAKETECQIAVELFKQHMSIPFIAGIMKCTEEQIKAWVQPKTTV